MEPITRPARPTGVRAPGLTLVALVLPFSLVACSGDDDGRVVSDPAPTSASATQTASPTPTKTSEPTPGTYPQFEPSDYVYDLAVQCFCMGAGVPIEVTVEGGEVVNAVYAQDDTGRGGGKAGEPADKRFWLSINDVIDLANDSEAERVSVDWPEGQGYPDQVFIDHRQDVADDEIGYTIGNVRL